MAHKSPPKKVSSAPLFDWFREDKNHRAKVRNAGYSDGRITNWKTRGIPMGEVGPLAKLMGTNFEEYMARARGDAHRNNRPVSDEALEIARAFDRMQPQTKERVRELVFVFSAIDRSFPWLRMGKPISEKYAKFEKWHEDNMRARITVEAQRIVEEGKKT